MSKIADVKLVFRTVNEKLNTLEEMGLSERQKTLEALKRINEEMCDQVVDLITRIEILKNEKGRRLQKTY